MTNNQETQPLRVLQIFNNLGMGGAETWIIEMLRRWHETKEISCDFLVTSAEPGTFDEEAKQLGARIFVQPFGKGQLQSFGRGLRKLLRTEKYAAVHDHQDRVSGWHFALGWPYLPPVRITHIHNPSYQIANNYEISLSRRITATFGKFFMRRLTTHIAATSFQVIQEYGFTATNYGHIPKAALHCAFNAERFVGNAVDAVAAVTQELNIPAESKMVLFAGRMDQSAQYDHPLNHKNSALAIDILLECIALDSSIHLLMAGAHSAALPHLQQRVAERGFESQVHFLGIRQDIPQLMLASNLLLFPSRGEGLGMVAVEAQATGLRVLASTAVPRECVVVPELVSFMDLDLPISQWATKVRELLAQPRPDSAAANRAVARSPFSVPICSQRMLTLYSQGKL